MNYKENFDLSYNNTIDHVERIDANKVSLEDFIEKYEKPYQPVIITGVTENWKASYKWTLEVSLAYFSSIVNF